MRRDQGNVVIKCKDSAMTQAGGKKIWFDHKYFEYELSGRKNENNNCKGRDIRIL